MTLLQITILVLPLHKVQQAALLALFVAPLQASLMGASGATGARFKCHWCALLARWWGALMARVAGVACARCRRGLCALQARPLTPFLGGAWGATSEAVLLEANAMNGV